MKNIAGSHRSMA